MQSLGVSRPSAPIPGTAAAGAMEGDNAVAPIACIILLREKFGFSNQTSGSEQYADPKLNSSWTGPAQHLAKLRCADSHAGTSSQAEYRVIENVEELGAQLDLILGSGVKTAISGLERLETAGLAEYVVDQVL